MHLNVSKIRRKKKKIRKLTEVENKKNFEIKSTDAIKNKKIKTNIDFSKNEYNSIKSIAIKGNTTIEVTSRFIKRNMLMFSKVPIRSFLYDLIDIFCFPDEADILWKFKYKISFLFNLNRHPHLFYFFQFYLYERIWHLRKQIQKSDFWNFKATQNYKKTWSF